MKQTPRIVASALTGSWFVLTRYRLVKGVDVKTQAPTVYYEAIEKFDVTEQMETILRYTAKAAATRAKGKRR